MEVQFQILGIHVKIVFALMDMWTVGIASVQGQTATILGQGRAAKTTAMVRALNIKITFRTNLVSQISLIFYLFFFFFYLNECTFR